MWFALLGQLYVRGDDGVEVLVEGVRQRILLAALLVRACQIVPADELAELLWDGALPGGAPAALRSHVKRLRQRLGPGGTRIVTRRNGYVIEVGGGELDLLRFADLCRTGVAAGHAGEWNEASRMLTEALRLWRGTPFADIPSERLVRDEIARLEEMRLQALEWRIEGDIRLGRAEQLAGELQAVVAAHPLRERFYAQLMVAFYQSGRQADALAAYQRARGVLVEELGVEPGADLRETHQRILTGSLELTERAPIAGQGSAPGVVPRQLPARIRHFAGRSKELKVLTDVLGPAGTSSTVLISAIGGTAGIGKTALALHWAHQVADQFPDGQLYIDLRGFGPSADPVTPADAVRRFLDALRVPGDRVPSSPDAQQDLYRSLLARRQMLILLDNARDAAQVRPLLPGGLGCVVLVTSRSQLASLVAVEGAYPMSLDVLAMPEARELLARRLGPERIAAEPDMVTELAELCAQLPLALAIAAARAALQPSMPLAALVAGLRDATGRLNALDAGEAASVRAVFSWSYRHLPTSARQMLRLLGIHPGPDITAAAAASLAGVGLDQARATLCQLTEASLLAEHALGRFRFHDLLRAYARERACAEDSEPMRRAATHRALDHYLHTAYSAALVLRPNREMISLDPPQPGVAPEPIGGYEHAMAWFEAEHRVLLGIEDQAVSTGFDTHGWQLPLCLTEFFDRRGYWRSYPAVQQAALAAACRRGDRKAQALVHRRIGHSSTLLSSYRDAEYHYDRALGLYRQLGDHAGQARVHLGVGSSLERQGRYREALAHCVQALTLYQSVGDRAWQAITLNNIGWCHARLGDYRQALASCQQAIGLHQELGDQHSEAHAWDSLGYAHHHLGQHAEAVSSYQQALALFRQLGDRLNEAEILDHLGDAHHADRKPQLALKTWRQAMAILDDLRLPGADQIRAKLKQSAPL
jgi:DNA-binding SARP family transcriptional activator/tetratricopeptide (TPR) repeat protein